MCLLTKNNNDKKKMYVLDRYFVQNQNFITLKLKNIKIPGFLMILFRIPDFFKISQILSFFSIPSFLANLKESLHSMFFVLDSPFIQNSSMTN